MRTIQFGTPITGKEEEERIIKVLRSGHLVHGPCAKEFESNFANYIKSPFAISVSSCTAALHLSYFYLGLKEGDEVIVPSQTHCATVHAVELTGAKPIFIDSEAVTGNIDIDQIENHISERTKAISIVHFLGMPVDMERINVIAKKHNLFVVEDSALAVGTYYKGIHAGLWGDVGAFSFYPVKHFTTAEGGMLTTKNQEIAKKIERQKAFGVDRTVNERKIPGVYDVNLLGYNYRMNEISAAIGIEQLKRLNSFLEKRQRNYLLLESLLTGVNEISLLRSSYGDFQSSYYCLSVILNGDLAAKRYKVIEKLNLSGVGTSVYYPRPVPHLTYYKNKYNIPENSFPNASRISYDSIALPVGPHLCEEDMIYIADKLKTALLESKYD